MTISNFDKNKSETRSVDRFPAILKMHAGAKRSSTLANMLATFTLAAVGALLVLMAALGGATTPASAQSSCQIDFGILQKKRMAQYAVINKSVKRSKGKLDARTACPRLRNLAATEREMVSYMKKNKSWCGIPDDPIKQMEQTARKTGATAANACKAAAMMKKAIAQARRQQQMQAQNPALQRPKLPAGPL